MNRSGVLLLPMAALAIAILIQKVDCATAQEVALTPMQASEVARGYRAESLKLKPVVNDKGETLGRLSDFILGKDGNVYAVLAVGDFVGESNHAVAVPFRNLRVDDPSDKIVIPGTSRAALHKLPVLFTDQ